MYYVYFLELSNQHIYVGHISDLNARLQKYEAGHVPSTKKYLPLHLKSYVAVETRETAIALETYFKSGSGKAFAKKRFLTSSSQGTLS